MSRFRRWLLYASEMLATGGFGYSKPRCCTKTSAAKDAEWRKWVSCQVEIVLEKARLVGTGICESYEAWLGLEELLRYQLEARKEKGHVETDRGPGNEH